MTGRLFHSFYLSILLDNIPIAIFKSVAVNRSDFLCLAILHPESRIFSTKFSAISTKN